jgi:hypothetical protein
MCTNVLNTEFGETHESATIFSVVQINVVHGNGTVKPL